MENIPIPQAAPVSPAEAEQIARIMESVKTKLDAPSTSTPPTIQPLSVTDNKTEPVVVPTVKPPQVQVKQLSKEEYDKIKNSPPVELPDAMKEKIQSVVLDNLANERATREPFPDNTAEAFDPVDPVVTVFNLDKQQDETLTIRPMVPADLRTFKLTNSPIYHLIMGDIGTEAEAINRFSIEENALYDLVWQFTHTSREASILAKKGADAFHDVSFDLAHTYLAGDLSKIVQVVIGYISQSNQARSSFTAAKTEEGDDKKKQSLINPKDSAPIQTT